MINEIIKILTYSNKRHSFVEWPAYYYNKKNLPTSKNNKVVIQKTDEEGQTFETKV